MAGIDSLVNSRADMFAANPQGLQQRYAMNQDLLDLLALQKLKKDKEAAQRSLQMQMQPESGTVKDQLEGQMMQATKQEVASALAPGIQQQGQAMQAQQLQQAMSGIASQPAPNMVGMARGGIVGYQQGGGPVGEEEQRLTPWQIRQAEKERHREGGQELAGYINDAGEWVAENPLEAASYAALLASGAGVLPAVGRAAIPALRAAGPRAMQGLRSLYSKANPAYWSRVSKAGNTIYPKGVPERLFSPGRTAATGAGLMALDAGLDMFGDGETGATEVGRASPSPSTQTPTAAATPAPTTAAPRLPQVDSAYDRTQGITPDAVDTLQDIRATPTAAAVSKDPRMSRYEAQLARLEAEETDKLGALIAFLQGAGASGGTNLGATLMGGGSGIQARDARIRDEMTQTVKNIEDLQFQRDEMQARRDETAEDRALRLQLEQMGIGSAEKRSAAEIAARAELSRLDREVQKAISEAELSGRVDTDTTNRLTQQRLILADQYETIQSQLAGGMVSEGQRDKLLAELDMVNAAMAALFTQLQGGAEGVGGGQNAAGAGYSQRVLDALKIARGQ